MTQPTLRITWLAGSFFERHGQRDRAIVLYREYIDSAPGADILVPMLERAEQGGETPVAVADAADGLPDVLLTPSALLTQAQADDAPPLPLHHALALTPPFMLARMPPPPTPHDRDAHVAEKSVSARVNLRAPPQ